MGEEVLQRQLEVEDTTAVPFWTMCLPEWSTESQEELKSGLPCSFGESYHNRTPRSCLLVYTRCVGWKRDQKDIAEA